MARIIHAGQGTHTGTLWLILINDFNHDPGYIYVRINYLA